MLFLEDKRTSLCRYHAVFPRSCSSAAIAVTTPEQNLPLAGFNSPSPDGFNPSKCLQREEKASQEEEKLWNGEISPQKHSQGGDAHASLEMTSS